MKLKKGLNKLKSIFGSRFITDEDILVSYINDESSIKSEVSPIGVIQPLTTEEVSSIAKICYKYDIPYIIRGAGTGKSGGAVPTKRSIIVSLTRMDKLRIIKEDMIAYAQPGVIVFNLQKEAEKYGLFYPVDPASLDISTIGGNIAENSGGPRAFKYGVTRDYILGLDVVLPDGTITRLGGITRKNVTGYSLKDLIISSEGTLATITGAYIKLLPYPKYRILLWAMFQNIEKSLSAINKIYTSGITPSAIEFIENKALKAVEALKKERIPNSDYPMHLLIEVDGTVIEHVEEDARFIYKIIEKDCEEILIAPFSSIQKNIWEIRRIISEATKHISFNKLSEDITLPPSKLPLFFKDLRQIEIDNGINIICYGHIGDGNIHVNILNTKDETGIIWEGTKDKILKTIFEKAIEYNGVLSGEHGIGLTKKKYFIKYEPKINIELHKKIKKIFDPKNLLNPDKIW
ncbi:MAG TPA: FAD-binding oxidoreductase [Spirochaetota bacterium]|nr:FAD-binding oxidoreductase [Spirochaetota bacterium]HOM38090.1 FAD-binding oxidoreductase [Spirochaetota bacterium]HPQ48892.1 FAD-binding oxidoreductase [Spirochaetota bacterium]